MEQVQRRDFLKNMGGIAATAAVIGTTMAPAARAAGFSDTDGRNNHHEDCWDNDKSCQFQFCDWDDICDEQFDCFCWFEIRCDNDKRNKKCDFDVFCQGNGQSWRKKCDDGHKKKHHWRFRQCEQRKSCFWQDKKCEIPCKLVCHCKDDDGCGYKDHCINLTCVCFVDDNGRCCYKVRCDGWTAS
jgi:hypothetical protein